MSLFLVFSLGEIDFTKSRLRTDFGRGFYLYDLLPKIKESGHSLYYLSNYHKELRDFVVNNNNKQKVSEQR